MVLSSRSVLLATLLLFIGTMIPSGSYAVQAANDRSEEDHPAHPERQLASRLACPHATEEFYDRNFQVITTSSPVQCSDKDAYALSSFVMAHSMYMFSGQVMSTSSGTQFTFSSAACSSRREHSRYYRPRRLRWKFDVQGKIGFHVATSDARKYRCALCNSDNWDGRRLAPTSRSQKEILTSTEARISGELSRKVNDFFGRSRGHCLSGVNAQVYFKMVPKRENNCDDASPGSLFCCNPRGTSSPEQLCSNSAFRDPVACHSSRSTCQSSACNGDWIDVLA